MNENGRIDRQGTFSSLQLDTEASASVLDWRTNENVSSLSEPSPVKRKPSLKRPSEGDRKELLMKTGDTRIYFYYFRSIGWQYFLGFILITMAATFSSTFSRKIYSIYMHTR